MAKLIKDTNKYITQDRKQFAEKLFRTMYNSFEIEGIHIPMDKARKIAEEAMAKFISDPDQKQPV